jgi:hypothetical protein
VIVWRFDRFARSVKHLVLALEEFQSALASSTTRRLSIPRHPSVRPCSRSSELWLSWSET